MALAQNYNANGGKTWAQGDFSGDGSVDFTDLVILAQNYNSTRAPAGAAALLTSGPMPTMAEALARVATPTTTATPPTGNAPRPTKPPVSSKPIRVTPPPPPKPVSKIPPKTVAVPKPNPKQVAKPVTKSAPSMPAPPPPLIFSTQQIPATRKRVDVVGTEQSQYTIY